MDEAWTKLLKELKQTDISDVNMTKWDIMSEQLTVYFIYRHFADGMYDESFCERIKLAAVSAYIIRALWAVHCKRYGSINTDTIIEIARLYSSEVEYSEENMERLLIELSNN